MSVFSNSPSLDVFWVLAVNDSLNSFIHAPAVKTRNKLRHFEA